jgi:RecA/RadA recombinase
MRSWADADHRLGASTGLAGLDASLGGGWRLGEISEIVGARSTGRTSVLIATVAAATARGEIVGLVDAWDRFDPVSAAAAAVDLDRVLWVRGATLTVERARPDVLQQTVQRAIRAFDLIIRAGGFGVVVLDVAGAPVRALQALPFTTWMRLAHANEGRQTAGLLVGERAMGRSARGACVQVDGAPHWIGTSAQSRRFNGFKLCAEIKVDLSIHRSFDLSNRQNEPSPEPTGVFQSINSAIDR